MQCDEQTPECGGCVRTKQKCPGYINHFDLAWRDQTTVAKKGVERGKAKRKAARERQEAVAKSQVSAIDGHTPKDYEDSSSSSSSSRSPNAVFTPMSDGSHRSSASSVVESDPELSVQRYSKPSLQSDPYLTLIRPIPEEQAMCFFFNNYVLPVRDPLARKGFLEHLPQFYNNTDPQSPLKLSTLAVASAMMSTGMGRPPDSALSRLCYVRAVSRLKERVSERKDCAGDELLVAVMLLHLYEVGHSSEAQASLLMEHQATIGNLAKRVINTHPHLDGALALIRHRGPHDFKTTVSRQILYYVRSLLVGSYTFLVLQSLILIDRRSLAKFFTAPS
jgi:hypothetical protein